MKLFSGSLLVVAVAGFAAGAAPQSALKGNDPVALTEGEESQGKEEFSLSSGAYRYLFLNAENRRRFETDPERFGVQMGGACARMGPLSGEGSATRWFVHDGRIYLFASEACRSTFKKAPEDFIDRGDAPPEASPMQRARGRTLLDLAVNAHGGAGKLDAARVHRLELTLIYRRGVEEQKGELALTFAHPGRQRQEETWGTSKYGHVITPEGGFLFSGGRKKDMTSQVRAFARRELYRYPIALLQARNAPGFVAVAELATKEEGAAVDWLIVHYEGATSRLGLESASGRIVEMTYRGRGERIGKILKAYSDFRAVEGVLFPFGVEASLNGKLVTTPEVRMSKVTVERTVDESLFSKSAAD